MNISWNILQYFVIFNRLMMKSFSKNICHIFGRIMSFKEKFFVQNSWINATYSYINRNQISFNFARATRVFKKNSIKILYLLILIMIKSEFIISTQKSAIDYYLYNAAVTQRHNEWKHWYKHADSVLITLLFVN